MEINANGWHRYIETEPDEPVLGRTGQLALGGADHVCLIIYAEPQNKEIPQ